MIIAQEFPAAFSRGFDECKAHYELVNAGERKETDFPPHPFQNFDYLDIPQHRTEWHAYNAGWFHAVPA